MDEDQAKEMKENIFQLLHQFEGYAIFEYRSFKKLFFLSLLGAHHSQSSVYVNSVSILKSITTR